MKETRTFVEPTVEALAWGEHMIQSVQQGKRWGVPMSLSLYRFNHDEFELHHLNGPEDDGHEHIICVFEMLGYVVLDYRTSSLDRISHDPPHSFLDRF